MLHHCDEASSSSDRGRIAWPMGYLQLLFEFYLLRMKRAEDDTRRAYLKRRAAAPRWMHDSVGDGHWLIGRLRLLSEQERQLGTCGGLVVYYRLSVPMVSPWSGPSRLMAGIGGGNGVRCVFRPPCFPSHCRSSRASRGVEGYHVEYEVLYPGT